MVDGRIVHVGLHRTASTWLQSQFFPKVGGVHNDFRNPWDDPTITALVNGGDLPPLPEDCIISAERLSGHPRSGWYDANSIADRIQHKFPSAKIVVGHRDMTTWVPSIYKMLVNLGETRTLEDLLTPAWERPYMDLSRIELEVLKDRYQSRFDQVLFLPLERLRSDFENYVRELSSFIGARPPLVDPDPEGNYRNWNVERVRKLNYFRSGMYNRSPIIDARWLIRFVGIQFQRVERMWSHLSSFRA